MNQFKRTKVVMLPTNEKEISSKYLVINKEGKLCIWNTDTIGTQHTLSTQHLYITVDDKIKEGDFVIDIDRNELYKYKGFDNIYDSFVTLDGGFTLKTDPISFRKIIATTDSSLEENFGPLKISGLDYFKPLPQPSQQFIEKYVEEYNKGNVITDILVEYEDIEYKMTVEGEGFDDYSYRRFENKIKVNPKDNTVTIKKVKDTFTREETVRIALKMQYDYSEYKKSCHYGPNLREIAEWTNTWLEENL